MKDIFTEFVIMVICGLLGFMFLFGGVFYLDHEATLMKYHCRNAAIEQKYTAAEVQVMCMKPTN